MAHQPVLLQEVIEGLALGSGEIFVDATVNRGGHSQKLCSFLGETGRLVGIDEDAAAIKGANRALEDCPCRANLVQGNFRNLDQILDGLGVEEIDAALFDLGWSSDELEESGRGFSFLRDEPLLMTYKSEPGVEDLTAGKIVNSWSVPRLAGILRDYGEERFAERIARAITEARREARITTTAELVAIIKKALPEWYCRRRLHPATKTFQALRIAVNDELGALEEGLKKVWEKLRSGGRLAVITFHSLEARLVKEFFKNKKAEGSGELLTRHAIKPARAEVLKNPRARSAQLRIIKKQS